MTTPDAPAAACPGLSKVRQVPWGCLGFLSGLAAYGVPAATEINTNGEWGWLVVLYAWALIFPVWIIACVLLIVLPGNRGTRRRPYGIGLVLGPAPLLLCAAALVFGVGVFL